MRGKRWKAATIMGAAGLLLAGVSACVLDVPYDKYAVVYGVADYGGLLSTLNYTDDDADAMYQLLFVSQGFDVVTLRKNSAATRAQLLTDFNDIALVAGEDDLFVFYFSGHGGPEGIGPEAEGGDAEDEWICLYGSDETPDLSTTFSDDALIAALRLIPCRKKLIILDACNSGGFIGNELEADGEPPSLAEDSESAAGQAARAIRLYANFDGSSADIPPWEALVLAAAGERELSYESSSYGHGVFTYYLLEAESAGDGNADGWVTVTEAYAYVREKIYTNWNRQLGPYYAYAPHVSGGPVDYVLFQAR
jgi:uncharacterized caspase-like protein